MGKAKRGPEDVEDILSRPWCYYCERDFEDLKLLISHQKAKHFKCDRCGKRLNTAGGLSVHMNQVHKESLEHVENALPNRQSLDIEIFGMEGVPEEVIGQHTQRIIQSFYQAQAERFAATGNPPPGQGGTGQRPMKKIRVETPEELKKRLQDHKARVAAQRNGQAPPAPALAPPQNGHGQVVDGQSPGQSNPPFPPPQPGFAPPAAFAQPGFPQPPNPSFPPAYAPGGVAAFAPLPNRPPAHAPGSDVGLPQRPPYGGGAPFFPGGAMQPGAAGDDLAGSVARHGDDIDQMIRMVTEGIRPPPPASAAPASGGEAGEDAAGGGGAAAGGVDKKGRKDKEKNVRMVYSDAEFSPEERMAGLARYAFVQEAA